MAETEDEGIARRTRWIKISLVGFLAALVVLPVMCSDPPDPAVERAAALAEAQTVTAEQITADWGVNIVAAKERYSVGPLLITGTVHDIGEVRSHPYLDLAPGGDAVLARFAIGDTAGVAKLRRGDVVTVLCRVMLAGEEPMFDDCELAEEKLGPGSSPG